MKNKYHGFYIRNNAIAILFGLLLTIIPMFRTYGEVPDKINYQAVVRGASNNLVVNQPIGLRVSIIKGSATGTEVYREIYNPNPETNDNGLITVEIGTGIPLTGTFSGIDWADGPYFLKTEIDPTGGTNYTITGTTQLLSVPFAFHARTAESLIGGGGGGAPSGPAGGDLSGSYPDPAIAANAVTTEKIADNAISTAKIANSAVAAEKIANNAITEEKIANNAVTSAKIADNAVSAAKIANSAVTSAKIADNAVTIAKLPAGATNTTFLRGDGTWATPASGGSEFSLPFEGTTGAGTFALRVGHTATTGNNFGLHAQSSSTSGRGVYGGAIATTGTTFGVRGESMSNEGTGVFGWAAANTGTTYGVRGQVTSANGYSGHFTGGKFYVEGNTGIGVTDPTQKLDVNGQVRIRGGNPGAGKVLTSSANGTASWADSHWTLSGTVLSNNNQTGRVDIKSSGSNPLRIDGGSPMWVAIHENGNYLGYFGSFSGDTNDVDFGTGAASTAKTHLVTRASPRLTVDQNGNVGIGTVNPSQRLQVNGNISLSGDLRRNETGVANVAPIAYGVVNANGTIRPGNTGNFTVTKAGTGSYDIIISGHNYHFDNYTAVCSLVGGTPAFITHSSVSGRLLIRTFNTASQDSDRAFSFVVYKR